MNFDLLFFNKWIYVMKFNSIVIIVMKNNYLFKIKFYNL